MPGMVVQPRQFVKPVPLPISAQHGVLIQARSQSVYNPCVPSRDEVRHINYRRRQSQLTQQGFRSVNYEPYKGIGDPFYLDQKKLILHALGQWNEGEDSDGGGSDISSDGDVHLPTTDSHKPLSSTSYRWRRSIKGLNTLHKEVSQGREMIKGVKLGHGLFQLLQKQNEKQTADKQRELQQKREKQLSDWQPPRSDDSDVSEDDELHDEVDLRRYMVSCSVTGPSGEESSPTFLTQSHSDRHLESRNVLFTDVQSPVHKTDKTKSVFSVNLSSAGTKRLKKHGVLARPFTPQHNNINVDYSQPSENKEQREAMFRQLCVLYWLLEAMNCPDPTSMSPVTTSWNLKDIGGSKSVVPIKQLREKTDINWRRFASNSNQIYKSVPAPPTVAPPVVQARRQNQGRARASVRHGSARQRGSASSTPSGSQSQLNLSAASSVSGHPIAGTGWRSEQATIPEDPTVPDPDPGAGEEHAELTDKHFRAQHASTTPDKGIDVPPVVPPTEKSDTEATRPHRDDKIPPRRSTNSPKRTAKTNVIGDNKAQILESLSRSEEDPRLQRLSPTEKRSSTSLRAEANVRPCSTLEVLQYQATLPSTHLSLLPNKLRSEFEEVTEEKAHLLHDTLESMDREKMRKFRQMFVRVPLKTSLKKTLLKMRPRTITESEVEKRRRSSLHQQWYLDLTTAMSEYAGECWYFNKILDKLSKYGMVEGVKQSSFKLRRVLKTLRDWEICSPDVCAAIEFCRERIVDMSIEEYEDWFASSFPTIERPQTAPPTVGRGKNDGTAMTN